MSASSGVRGYSTAGLCDWPKRLSAASGCFGDASRRRLAGTWNCDSGGADPRAGAVGCLSRLPRACCGAYFAGFLAISYPRGKHLQRGLGQVLSRFSPFRVPKASEYTQFVRVIPFWVHTFQPTLPGYLGSTRSIGEDPNHSRS
jgi:hypothetical protein